MFRLTVLKAALASVLAIVSTSASALEDQWFVGVGGGASLLQPNPVDRAIDVEEEQGEVATFFFGRDFDRRSSAQLQLYSLGEALFDNGGEDMATYYAGDASILFRFYDSRDNAKRGTIFGASLYGRFGLGFIERDSDLSLRNDAQVYFGAGAGIESYLTNNLAMRFESMYHENDVGSATFSLVGRFGGRQSTRPVLPPRIQFPQAETATAETPAAQQPELKADTPIVPVLPDVPLVSAAPGSAQVPQISDDTAEAPIDVGLPEVEIMADVEENISADAPIDAVQPEPVSIPEPEPESEFDLDKDGLADTRDQCQQSTPGFPVNRFGCPVFNGIVPGIEFLIDSEELASSNNQELNILARLLKMYPASRFTIVAYTDNSGSRSEQSDRTRARLGTIARYLLGQGVSRTQLKAQLVFDSLGGRTPDDGNSTTQGPGNSNRIEIFELPQ